MLPTCACGGQVTQSFSLPRVGPRDSIQLLRFSSKDLYLLSHFPGINLNITSNALEIND